MKSFMIFTFTNYYQVDEVKEYKMGRACGIYGGEQKCIQGGFWWGNLRERGNVDNLGIDDRIILKCILKK